MENLVGKMVLVSPYLTDDPFQHQGQIGIITGVQSDIDKIQVGFGDGILPHYKPSELMILKTHQEIYNKLLESAQSKAILPDDFKTLIKISMMLESGTSQQIRNAFELSQQSVVTLEESTISLEKTISHDINNRVEERKAVSR